MSYGTAPGVAALAKRYTNNGSWTTDTNPSQATVTGWLAQISAMVNIALATKGFTTPITDTDVTPALDGLVNALAADLAASANSSGRFYTDKALENGVSPLAIIRKDILAWVDANADGLKALGASRTASPAMNILTRTADEGGHETAPIFQRDAFGNHFDNWDAA